MTGVAQGDWDAMRAFVGSSDCPVGMKMMFHGSVCNALAKAFAAHRIAALEEQATAIRNLKGAGA